MSTKKLTIILLLSFFIINSLIIILAQRFIPYLGFFPYKEIAQGYGLPPFLTALANFDGAHYILTAKEGYFQYAQAFFPLFPLTIRLLSLLFGNNHLIAGLLVANISFIFGFIIFTKYIPLLLNEKKKTLWTILFLLAFPSSFYFHTVYTEALFFVMFIAMLYNLQKKRYVLTALFGYLTGLTRVIGIFATLPLATVFFFDWLHQKKDSKRPLARKKLFTYIFTTLSPFLGFLSYSIYLWKTTGDPLFFFTAQPKFGANRSTHIIFLPQVIYRYLKIFVTAQHNFQYFVALIEFIVFSIVFGLLLWELYHLVRHHYKEEKRFFSIRLGLNLFSLAAIILPTLTGTLQSIPRFALLTLSVFIAAAELPKRWMKAILLIIFALLHIILFSLFVQGYFVG